MKKLALIVHKERFVEWIRSVRSVTIENVGNNITSM